jgi:hypothetical protein
VRPTLRLLFSFLYEDVLISRGINPGQQLVLRNAFLYVVLFVIVQYIVRAGYPMWFVKLFTMAAYAGWYVVLFDRYPSSTPF